MIEQLLEMINEKYPLSEMEVGDMKSLKANGMKGYYDEVVPGDFVWDGLMNITLHRL